MKKIDISTKKHPNVFALVDDEDFEYLNQWKWNLSTSGYARRLRRVGEKVKGHKNKTIWMHRIINNTPENLITDHRNQNKLGNTRKNLRTADKSLNSINRGKLSNNVSGYKGVYFDSWTSKWRAGIKIHYKKISLGRFIKIEDAIIARKKGEEKYHAI